MSDEDPRDELVRLRERTEQLEGRLQELRGAVREAITSYNDGTDARVVFAQLEQRIPQVAARWDEAAIVTKAQEWFEQFGQAPAAIDWAPSEMKLKGREHLLERWTSGDWPSQATVKRYFGTWNDMLHRADLPVRATNQGGRGPRRTDFEGLPVWEGWTAIGALRTGQGLRKVEVARRSGLNYKTVLAIEAGQQTNPTVRVLLALAHGLAIDGATLLDRTSPPDS